MNNEFKTQLQKREFDVLKDEHRVILKWATGCGKSKMTIDLINNAVKKHHLQNYKYEEPVSILLVVGETAHKKNWKEELNTWELDYDHCYTDIICYQSLHKVIGLCYDIIVCDEAHHLFTEKRMAAMEAIINKTKEQDPGTPGYVFLLSATLSSSKVMMAEEMFGKFAISTVTLKDAISNDILPDPRVYVVAMELDNVRDDQEIMANKADEGSPVVSWDRRFKYLSKKLPCIIRCTEKQKYLYYSDTMEYWKQRYERSKNQFHHNLWVSTGSLRKRYLGELKTYAVRDFLKRVPYKKRFVCFCASVAQAELFSRTHTISSKKPSRKNQEIIDAFNSRKINQIYAVGMITEGMNLTDIQAGIIVQLDGKERLFVQKFGRSLRAEDPVTFIFYYKGTQDEVYLKNALENIDSKYVQHISIDQLDTVRL